MFLILRKINIQYLAIILMAVLAGLLISFYNLSILFLLASILFVVISFKYFNQVLFLLILYLPFQIALNISPDVDIASGRVLILYLFAVWVIKSFAEKKFIIRLNLQTLLILLFLFIACFSMLGAWDGERAIRKILVFFSIFPLYFIITSNSWLHSSRLGTVETACRFASGLHSSARLWSKWVMDKNNFISWILDALFISGFILSLIGVVQFLLQFFIGIDPIILFWSEYIAPVFYGNAFGAQVVSNPSWLVNISGATVLRAFSLFPDPHMFSFYLGLLIPIVLAAVLFNKNNADCHSEFISESVGDNGLASFQFLKQSIMKVRNVCGNKQKILELNSGQALKQACLSGRQVQDDRNNKILYIILATMFLAELLTFSRGGYLSMIFGVGAVVILGWRYASLFKKVALGLVVGAAIIFSLTANQSIVNRFLSSFDFNEGSNSERMKNWSQGLEMFNDNFLSGVGIGNYSYEIKPTADYRTPIYAHNAYLDIGAEMGVVALIIWLALILTTTYQLLKLSRNTEDNFLRSVSFGLIGSLAWFSTHGFFDTPIYSPTILAIFVIILSLSAMVLEKQKAEIS